MYVYLGEHLDALVADLEELELPVEPEDVHTSPRAAGVEDHSIPPRPRRWTLRRRRRRRRRLVVYDDASFPTEQGVRCKDRAAGVERRGH